MKLEDIDVESTTCLRGRNDCALIECHPSSDMSSFFCIGYNRKEDRAVKGDRFTVCFKNDVIDDRGHWDKRDLLDQVRVMTAALSVDENIRVSENLTDEEMNEIDLL